MLRTQTRESLNETKPNQPKARKKTEKKKECWGDHSNNGDESRGGKWGEKKDRKGQIKDRVGPRRVPRKKTRATKKSQRNQQKEKGAPLKPLNEGRKRKPDYQKTFCGAPLFLAEKIRNIK